MANKKIRLKIKEAMNDLAQNDNVSCDEPYKTVILALESLQEALSCGSLAPLPYDLKGSLYDPELLALRSDDEFCEVYDSDFKGTAEETIVSFVCFVLKYDLMHKKSKIHTKYRSLSCTLGFSRKPLKNISWYSFKLQDLILLRKDGMDDEKNMLYVAYNYFIQFAEAMQFDINVFVKWYLRRISIK